MRVLTVAALAVLGGALSAGAAEPTPFALVPAKPYVARDGLPNVFAKLDAGKEVRVAYFGGSITAAAGWRPQTMKWFTETWPKAKIVELNAAIGGTGSDLGVYRYQQDVLDHQPDLVFVEFSVNDGGATPENIWRGMEGIVRQTWAQDPTIDLCYVYTFRTGYENDLDQGNCPRAASADEVLADHYGIPSINMAQRIAALHKAGKLLFVPAKDADGKEQPTPVDQILFSHDGVHPIAETGHKLYTEDIVAAFAAFKTVGSPGPHQLKAPLQADHWQSAKLAKLDPAMLSPEWHKLGPDSSFVKGFTPRLPEVYEATTPGATLKFKFKGTAAKLYDLLGPDGGQVFVTVDGKTGAKPVARFDSYCSYHRLATLTIAEGLPDAVHEVELKLDSQQPDRHSVTDKEQSKPGFDPKKYDGTALRVGAILLRGDIVK